MGHKSAGSARCCGRPRSAPGTGRAARFWIAPAERSGDGALDFLQIVISSLLAAASARSRGIFRKYISDPSAPDAIEDGFAVAVLKRRV